MLRQGWTNLAFEDPVELPQLNQLHDALRKEIAAVTESLGELRAGPEYELYQLAGQKPGCLAELAAERRNHVAVEIAELESQAEKLAEQIKKLCGAEKVL